MSSGNYLVLRRHGLLWGLPAECVTEIGQDREATVVRTTVSELVVDEVVGRAAQVRISPLSAFSRRLMAGSVAALGVHQGACLLVVDPAAPPRTLRRSRGGVATASRRRRQREGEGTDGTT